MPRILLVMLVLALVALVVVDKAGDFLRSVPAPSPTAQTGTRLAAAPLAVARPTDTTSPDAPVTSPLDRLARLAVRQRIRGEADRVYLDSLLATTESVVRRWGNGSGGATLGVAIVPGGPPGYQPAMAGYVREALEAWDLRRLGLRWTEVQDTAGAAISVRWIDRFQIDRAGQTDLTWDRSGRIHRAVIVLAIHDTAGNALPPVAMRAVALHEVGHALGLPHSAETTDIMHPGAMAPRASDRDNRTLELLYELPPGSVRDSEHVAQKDSLTPSP